MEDTWKEVESPNINGKKTTKNGLISDSDFHVLPSSNIEQYPKSSVF